MTFGKKQKGEYGYRNWRKAVRIGEVLLGAAAIAVQLLARNFTDSQAMKNVLTIMAILSVLPTANVASPLLASFRYRTPPGEFYQKVRPYEGKGLILYDLIVTTKEQILPFDAVMVHPMGVFAFCPQEKLDAKKAERALNDSFRSMKLSFHVKIMKDEKSFFHRLEGLKPVSEYGDDGDVGSAARALKSMSM